ncbi:MULTISPECIES: c-type cytochrome [Burkholderia]|uniref:Cytochrome C n=1 Tax=Burkholderia mayonis TaxID=1385591 RepID=A0A1B4FF86_9BURK|nr:MULTISPECIES: c-type cytochrome [Burkholderia]AOJ02367.1 cytochrome C [Burkholderia mayonis]KVE36080.1 cytochrome C [Burkholderia sp. BDU5]KVE47112.1 cytochrome C [Burkholderia mayonis]
MSTERLFSIRNRWLTLSVGLTLFAVVASVLIGFVWLPSVQKDAQFQGIWNAICSAAGVPRAWLPSQPEPATVKTSAVVVTPQMMTQTDSLSIGRGATLAMRCTMCHGARGMSDANSPNLAGQYAAVIYKQLKDFQAGARTNAVMAPMVVNLSDQDMRDLAAFYSYLPRAAAKPAANRPKIVASGAPMRNIAPCASCHGGMDNKVGGPWLEGEPEVYINAQLQAFASGARHNDISEQMRNVARQMTLDEIAVAARYYAGRP